MPNSVVKISMAYAKYFEYYTIILGGGRFFVDTVYVCMSVSMSVRTQTSKATCPSFTIREVWTHEARNFLCTLRWLGPLTTLQYVMYFRFGGRRHVCPLSVRQRRHHQGIHSEWFARGQKTKSDVYDCLVWKLPTVDRITNEGNKKNTVHTGISKLQKPSTL